MTARHGPERTHNLAMLSKSGACLWRDGNALRIDVPSGATVARPVLEQVLGYFDGDLSDSSVPSCAGDVLVPLSGGRRGAANLVCVHAAHGTVYDYRHIAAAMDRKYPVYGLHSLRRLITLGMPQQLDGMAEIHATELVASGVCDIPFVLYGVSAGGLLALEIAQHLRRLGREPLAVVLGDTRDPDPASGRLNRELTERYFWLSFIGAYLPVSLLHAILARGGQGLWECEGNEARVRYLIEQIRCGGEDTFALPLRVEPFIEHLEPHRAHLNAYTQCRLAPYAGRCIYFKATNVSWDFSRHVRESLPADYRIHEMAGNHWALLDEKGAEVIADVIGEGMSATQPSIA